MSIYVFIYFPFGFEGSIWDLIVSVPDHFLSFYFKIVWGIALCTDSDQPTQPNCNILQDNILAARGFRFDNYVYYIQEKRIRENKISLKITFCPSNLQNSIKGILAGCMIEQVAR